MIGKNPVLEYLKSGKQVDQLLFHDKIKRNKWMDRVTRLARQKKVKYRFVPRKKLNALAEGANHQGVVAFISPVSYATVDDILAVADKKKEKPFIILLDSLKDPHNFGAIIRTAVAAGVHGIIIPKHGSVSITDTVFKTSAGAVAQCVIAKVTNLVQTMEYLKDKGLWFYGAEGSGDRNLYETDFSGAVGLIMGSEGRGMHQKVKEHCDFLVKIPMNKGVESLNVSVSAGLFIYKIFEQRINQNKS